MTSPILSLLMREMRLSEREAMQLVATAPDRYKVFRIRKRSGGWREIAQPSRELKVAQRLIMETVLQSLPVHPAATAYKLGSSIRKNALAHVNNRAILKFDFRNFFPSITERAWIAYSREHNLLDRDDAIIAGRILFRRQKGSKVLRLSIGAPSSPILSNILLNSFDREIAERVAAHKITYTRYADDMTFSAERTHNLLSVEKILRSVIRSVKYPSLELNDEKTVLVTPKFRKEVTGIILTNEGRLSIGRDRKRTIRSAIHKFTLGELGEREVAQTAGLLAFARDIEPEFAVRMERVYGREAILQLLRLGPTYRRPAASRRAGQGSP